ncbi:hypothetical protein G7Y89_g12128 [Cudoniella acicularis]|uniref:Uncharacterized protein n=1 Tax=Cudoniella acicularis TaxID=354080 RepID=A0A8H4RC02_9HELO|nr:hypothetical protein G7Y89_g12128 [Cudoniella acicularis]
MGGLGKEGCRKTCELCTNPSSRKYDENLGKLRTPSYSLASIPSPRPSPPIHQQTQNSKTTTHRDRAADLSDPSQPSLQPLPFFYDPPLAQKPLQPTSYSHTSNLPQLPPNLKRTSTYIDLTEKDDNQEPAAKRFRPELLENTAEEEFEPD